MHLILNALIGLENQNKATLPTFKVMVENIKLFLSHPDIDLTRENKKGETPTDLLGKIKDSTVQAAFDQCLKKQINMLLE